MCKAVYAQKIHYPACTYEAKVCGHAKLHSPKGGSWPGALERKGPLFALIPFASFFCALLSSKAHWVADTLLVDTVVTLGACGYTTPTRLAPNPASYGDCFRAPREGGNFDLLFRRESGRQCHVMYSHHKALLEGDGSVQSAAVWEGESHHASRAEQRD